LEDSLSTQQRIRQMDGAGIHLDLVLSLWTEHHARVPAPISAVAHQQ
jgi:hypothetical protein